MSKKVIKKIVLVGGLMIFVAGIWFLYTLTHYDIFFSPHYLIGLSDPDKYYQKNISDYLIENGHEFIIDDIDTLDWKTYKSEKDGFSFKYPNDYEVDNPDKDLKYTFFISKDKVNKNTDNIKSKCRVVVSYGGGWAISMPRTRNWMVDNSYHWYIFHNNMAYPVLNPRNENIEEKIKSGKFEKSVELLFFKGGEHYFITFKGDCSINMFKGVLSTVEF